MQVNNRLIYLHGSESDNNSGKARRFREWFPGMFTPDFTGSFNELMELLASRPQPKAVSVPTIIIHGTEDDVVPLEPAREIAQRLFTNLNYFVVDDGHRLQKAVHELNWKTILA